MSWYREAAGWYTSELGGIYLESSATAPNERGAGWYFYPIDRPHAEALGPVRTLAACKRLAEGEA